MVNFSKRISVLLGVLILLGFLCVLFVSLSCGENLIFPFEERDQKEDKPQEDDDSDTEEETDSDTQTETNTNNIDDNYISSRIYGYAAMPNYGLETTTGGALDVNPTYVATGQELQDLIDNKTDEPLTVFVTGTITLESSRLLISDKSDITIEGVSGGAEFDGVGITITNSSNIILKNLEIHHVSGGDLDTLRITGQSHHIWVDRCTFHNDETREHSTYDSLLDITHGCDHITFSWCVFRDNHRGILIGHNDGNEDGDKGKFNITFHHNVFSNIRPQVFTVRFGGVHFFNNLFTNIPFTDDEDGVGISARAHSCLRIENNHFKNVHQPIRVDQSGNEPPLQGSVQLLDNIFEEAGFLVEEPTCSFEIEYDYFSVLNSTSVLEVLLKANAGSSFNSQNL